VEAEHGLDTMPMDLREGAVIPMGPGELLLDVPPGVELR
jgi:hypothetical protein